LYAPKDNLTSLGVYIKELLLSLRDVIQDRSSKNKYSYNGLATIFRLNNYYFIWKEVKNSELLSEVREESLEEYEKWYIEQKIEYFKCWDTCIGYLRENYKDGKKFYLRERFSGFNSELQTNLEKQQYFRIPDSELREQMRAELCQILVPKYSKFCSRYIDGNAAKKGYKYNPETVQQICIHKFFSGKLKEGKKQLVSQIKKHI